ncbi:flagellar protein FlbB [Spirochaetia bacterium]|nr:flagellar protein FlbB [Spirochaetia bacterium]
MAKYGKAQIAGRVVVLIILIAVMAGGGIVWFDYLNVIDAKTVLAPLYRLIGREGRTQSAAAPDEVLSLDAERLAIRLEALELQFLELDKQGEDMQSRRGEIEQMAQELEERQKALDERENSINAEAEQADTKARNVETIARYLTGMPPASAVGIINSYDDQQAIDVLRMTEDIARREGTTSLVSVWFQQMPPARAAELQRKMVGSPSSLD